MHRLLLRPINTCILHIVYIPSSILDNFVPESDMLNQNDVEGHTLYIDETDSESGYMVEDGVQELSNI